jgi:SSS family solute:Na+ symporter
MSCFHQLTALLCQLALAGLICATGCVTPRTKASKRQQLIHQLEQEMQANTSWVRIHAAEALIAHGVAEPVAASFAPEVNHVAPPYRMGVWRVMARAAQKPAERRKFIGQIHRVLLDANAADRLHAAESLAKLGIADATDRSALEWWLASADDASSVFPLWLNVLSARGDDRAKTEKRLASLLESKDPVARLRAASALGRIKPRAPETLWRLNQRLASEPADSSARVYLITATLLQAKRNSPAAGKLKSQLAIYLEDGKPNEQLEAATVLGKCGLAKDLPALTKLLNSSEADARIGAASGSLYLLR